MVDKQIKMLQEQVAALSGKILSLESTYDAKILALSLEISEAWRALGVEKEDAADDPETATLADSIMVSLQYERDKVTERNERLNEQSEKLRTAHRELREAREEITRLQREIARLIVSNTERERERDEKHAALGRAVAALQKQAVHRDVASKHDGYFDECRLCDRRWHNGDTDAHAPNCILADPTSAQAGEAWRSAVAYADALSQADCGEGKPSDLDAYRERFERAFETIAAVDAQSGTE